MQYAGKLREGDKVAIVSLSSGMLGEEFCSHRNRCKKIKRLWTGTGIYDKCIKGNGLT